MENIIKLLDNKKGLVIGGLIFLIVFFMVISIFFIGKKQVDTTTKLIDLKSTTIELMDSVGHLHQKHTVYKNELDMKDSLIQKQESVIDLQNKDLNVMKREVSKIKSSVQTKQIVYIHDTIVITEKKNFWGKTKKTIQQSSSVDSLEFNDNTETVE